MKKFEEPKFEKTEFEAVAYLCSNSKGKKGSNSNGSSKKWNSNQNKRYRRDINPFDNPMF